MASISDIDPLAAIGLEGLGIKPRLYSRSSEPEQLEKYSTRQGHRWNQDLESRGYLRFLYELSDGSYQDRVLPFIENPTFNESRSANYAENNILSRNEQARLYTGSKARRIDTSFSYTLPHLAHFVPTSDILKSLTEERNSKYTEKDLQQVKIYLASIIEKDVTKGALTPRETYGDYVLRDRLGLPEGLGPVTPLTSEEKVKQAKQVIADRKDSLEGPVGPFLKTNSDASLDSLWNTFLLHVIEASGKELEVLSVFQSAINHIRASVIGSSTNPKRSPPIVLLKWGAIYNEVPCIVRDYRIELTDRAGYNTKTLLPQQILVQMTLEEINQAHGSIPGRSTVTGNLPGYDTILRLTKPEDET
jgi:hypothetical protein